MSEVVQKIGYAQHNWTRLSSMMRSFADEVRIGLTSDVNKFTTAARGASSLPSMSRLTEAKFTRLSEELKLQIGVLTKFAGDYVGMSKKIVLPTLTRTHRHLLPIDLAKSWSGDWGNVMGDLKSALANRKSQ